ncbi:MAG TPA: ABC transporter substrate-binding protein [Solirubrobacteraceae bacterium]|nr:ABC transporter substrate-binding protein [Solirubrobacteraceae bacterium]
MRRSVQWTLILGVLLALSFGVAACGGDDDSDSGEQGTTAGTPAEGKKGGKLTALWAGDTDNIDPGITYYQMGTQIIRATQATLYSPKIDDAAVNEPQLAESDPQVAEDGCTVTVKIKEGWKFSPPVDRVVTTKDIKYAIERGFFSNVNNGYAGPYFGGLDGAKVGADPGTKIPGIETPDDTTIVFNLKPAEGQDKCAGGILAQALVMPLAAPVPEEYASKFDKGTNSTYGQNQVSTGPYMIENDTAGKAIGYEAGRRIHLVRNPNWDESLDNRPAYVDEIEVQQGNDDATVMARKILEGQSLITGDQPPPPAILKRALTDQKDQIALVPGGSGRWISLNTTVKPFDDLNVRKAVSAGMDRDALRLTRGGEAIGDIATHYLPPGLAGYEEAGAAEGFGLDFMANPKGDKALMAEYFKKAGFSSGKYEGSEKLLMVGDNEGVGAKTAEVAAEQLRGMGFNIELRQVTHDAMYNKFCNRPPSNTAICPNVGWIKDFSDPQTYLDPTFNGENIIQTNNVNWPELDVPEINQAMNDAKLLTDPAERAEAWAEIDRMVSEQAPTVNWIWDKDVSLQSSNVLGVIDEANGIWDWAHTSLK